MTTDAPPSPERAPARPPAPPPSPPPTPARAPARLPPNAVTVVLGSVRGFRALALCLARRAAAGPGPGRRAAGALYALLCGGRPPRFFGPIGRFLLERATYVPAPVPRKRRRGGPARGARLGRALLFPPGGGGEPPEGDRPGRP